MGGRSKEDYNDLWRFDFENMEWKLILSSTFPNKTTNTVFPPKVAFHSLVALPDSLLLFGGGSCGKGPLSNPLPGVTQSSRCTLNNQLWEYHIEERRWKLLNVFPSDSETNQIALSKDYTVAASPLTGDNKGHKGNDLDGRVTGDLPNQRYKHTLVCNDHFGQHINLHQLKQQLNPLIATKTQWKDPHEDPKKHSIIKSKEKGKKEKKSISNSKETQKKEKEKNENYDMLDGTMIGMNTTSCYLFGGESYTPYTYYNDVWQLVWMMDTGKLIIIVIIASQLMFFLMIYPADRKYYQSLVFAIWCFGGIALLGMVIYLLESIGEHTFRGLRIVAKANDKEV